MSMTRTKDIKKYESKFWEENKKDYWDKVSESANRTWTCMNSSYKNLPREWWIWYVNPPTGVLFHWGHGGIWNIWAIEILRTRSKCHFWRSSVTLVLEIMNKTIFSQYCLVTSVTFPTSLNLSGEAFEPVGNPEDDENLNISNGKILYLSKLT